MGNSFCSVCYEQTDEIKQPDVLAPLYQHCGVDSKEELQLELAKYVIICESKRPLRKLAYQNLFIYSTMLSNIRIMENSEEETKMTTTNRLLQKIYTYYKVENKDGLNNMLQESVMNLMTEDIKYSIQKIRFDMKSYSTSLIHIQFIETILSTDILSEEIINIMITYAIPEDAFNQ